MNLGKTSYGGDWNPEQWDRAVWDEDVRLFKEAGIDLLTINIFSWTLLQPDEETYNFAMLDEIIALLHANGMKVCLGTGTAAHPAWMATKYPDSLRVDFQGRKRKFGDRHNSSPRVPRTFASRQNLRPPSPNATRIIRPSPCGTSRTNLVEPAIARIANADFENGCVNVTARSRI